MTYNEGFYYTDCSRVLRTDKTTMKHLYCTGYIPKKDGNSMTEEEWKAQQMEEKSRNERDDREMKGYQR
jgi:hypothetical protein